MTTQIDLAKSCEEGQVRIEEFCELLGTRPRRTHLLDTGDYVVLTPTDMKDTYSGNVLAVEKIDRLDSPEKGDFVTTRGTIGPMNGNVFVKIQRGKFPICLLIEGDRIGEPACPIPVYDLVNKYLESKHSQN
mgnify:CR=1 FL=1